MKIKETVLKTLEKLTNKKIQLQDKILELGIDSLDLVQTIAELEEKYELEITDEELQKLITVQDIVDLLNEKF